MSRRRKEEESSFELLLDTMCNTFGGVMFIAISIFVIIVGMVQHEQQQESSIPSDPAAIQQEIESLKTVLAELQRQIQTKNEILRLQKLEKTDEIVKNRRLITDDSLYQILNILAKDTISYQQNEYQLGEILAKIALEKIYNGEDTNWRNIKPLYIQPPPVFGK